MTSQDTPLNIAGRDYQSRLIVGSGKYASFHDFAERHRRVIRKFGRFPHRNAALNRESTSEETAYLAKPGAGF